MQYLMYACIHTYIHIFMYKRTATDVVNQFRQASYTFPYECYIFFDEMLHIVLQCHIFSYNASCFRITRHSSFVVKVRMNFHTNDTDFQTSVPAKTTDMKICGSALVTPNACWTGLRRVPATKIWRYMHV
jgi:hypothetical protein